MKKAFIFTIDGLIALMLAVILFTSAGYMLSQFSPPAVLPLEFAQSSLEMLDSSGDLAGLVNSNVSVQQYLNLLPNQYCAEINLYDEYGEIVSLNKTGCVFSSKQFVAYRGFYVDDFYVAQMVISLNNVRLQ